MTFFPTVRSNTPGAFLLQAGSEPAPGYRLRRVRGRGGFAEVWEADAPSGTPVALKFMVSSNTATTARELRSHQLLQSLDHPLLVATQAVWSVPGYIVIAMELAEASLLDLLSLYHHDLGQHIPAKQLCLHVWQIGEGLDFLNARRHTRDGRKVGYQHGDVKPNNVLLFGDVAKLTDYGLATPTHGPTTPCPRFGTREYAAPEVFQGNLTDSSDQYSLAVSYVVLRTGGFPFPTPPATVPANFRRPPPDLRGLSAAEQPLIARALSPTPQDRFPTCGDLTRALLKVNGLKPDPLDATATRLVPDTETVPDSAVRRKSWPG